MLSRRIQKNKENLNKIKGSAFPKAWKGGAIKFVYSSAMAQTVPLTTKVAIPGVTVYSPVTGS